MRRVFAWDVVSRPVACARLKGVAHSTRTSTSLESVPVTLRGLPPSIDASGEGIASMSRSTLERAGSPASLTA